MIAEAKRFNVVNCGRRFGKTVLGINRAITPEVLPHPVGWFSPTYKMLLEVWREVVRRLQPVTVRVSSGEHRIENIAGGVLEFWSLENPDSARGRKYKRIIVDEAAMVPMLMEAWQFVLRPTLVDYKGDAWFLSTPKGRNGFWQMWQWGQSPDYEEWASWQMPSSVNPKVPLSEIDAMRKDMSERRFAQEVMAEFVEDAGGVFRNVAACATAKQADGRRGDAVYIAGLDWALSYDFTVLSIINVNTRELVYLDRYNGVDYSMQRQRIKAVCDRLGVAGIVAESNAMGKPNNDELRRMGLPVRDFVTTNTTKADIIENLAAAFEQGNIRILNDAQLIAELQAYEVSRLPSGMVRYSAPEGMHDDCVMSLAMAWHGASAAQRKRATVREY